MADRARNGIGRPQAGSLALFACLFVLGCDDPVEVQEPDIVGTWLLGQNALQLGDAGTVTVSLNGAAGLAAPDIIGGYSISETTLSLSDTSGSQACDVGVVGRYTFAVDATSLSFDVLTDGCSGRTNFLTAASWSRQ